MADDDDMLDEVEEEELEPDELDSDDIEGDIDEDELDDEFADDGDFDGDDGDDSDDTDDDDEDDDSTGPVRRSVASDDDEDDDMLAPDDVEADLDTILKDRLVTADDDGGEEEEDEVEDRSESADRIQPKRADEQLCPSCFLLVRQAAPGCPVGDDECPLFT